MKSEMGKFYEDELELKGGWNVEDVKKDNQKREMKVEIFYHIASGYKCPKCGRDAVYHDTRVREIRHIDTCSYETWLEVHYPRVKCKICGKTAITPPFAEKSSRFSKSFETRIIQLCKNSSKVKVAKDYRLDWDAVEGIIKRGAKRGMDRQTQKPGRTVRRLYMDEITFGKRHNYCTIIGDSDKKTVIAVLPDRDSAIVTLWFATQQVADFSKLKSVSMDMALPFIKAVKDFFPNSDDLICFDRFHVAQLFNRAVDEIRRRESATFKKGHNPFTGTRFDWLRNSSKTDNRTSRRRRFLELTKQSFDTVKAWRLKEQASKLWNYSREGSAEKAWKKLFWRLSHSQIPELKRLGKTIKRHLVGILNAIKQRANNGMAEARNSCIQRIKRIACGFRDKARFGLEIIFQYGGLNMAF